MIKDAKLLARFEQVQIKSERLTYPKALRLAEALWEEARALKIFPRQNPLEDIETDIHLAQILNSRV